MGTTYMLNCDNCGSVFESEDAFPERHLCPRCLIVFKAGYEKGLQATGAISHLDVYNDGKREGVRKLVEWINTQNTLKLKSLQGTKDWFKHCGLLIPMETWQAKLKE